MFVQRTSNLITYPLSPVWMGNDHNVRTYTMLKDVSFNP
jgi:hypothetical protein